jgi:hypothetical protein
MTKPIVGAYVYEIAVAGVVRYIGKGRGNRAESHLSIARRLNRKMAVGAKVRRSRFYKLLSEALAAGEPIEVRYATVGLSDEVAFDMERDAIRAAPFGQLWNSALGGEGQDAEYLRSLMTEERREFHRQQAKAAWARNPDRKQARFAEDGAREEQSRMLKEKWADPEYRAMQRAARSKARPSRQGAKVPALSSPAKARWADPDFKARASSAIREAVSRRTPEERAATAAKLAAIRASPEYRARLSEGLRAAHARRRAVA